MPIDAILLVLLAAAAHTGWNLLVHQVPDRLATMAVGAGFAALLLSWDVVAHPPLPQWPYVLVSGAAETMYAVLLAGAYARGSLAVAYPVGRGTAPLLVTVLAWPLAGERPAAQAVLGACCLAVGLFIVAGVGRAAGQGGAVGYALGTGAAIAVYSTVDAVAVRTASAAGYLGTVLLMQGVLLVIVARIGPGRLRRAIRPGMAVGTGVVAAYLLVLLAFQRAPAGRVATLREVSVLFAIAVSADRRRRSLWVGAGLVALGAVAAATG
jgi:drug/metabolite transporter (DMT)-like permease